MCRWPAYVGPGLPSPTTSQTSLVVMAAVPARRVDRVSARSQPGRRGAHSAESPSAERSPSADSPSAASPSAASAASSSRLVVLDAGLGLGLGELGLELLGGLRLGHVDDQGLGVGEQRASPRGARGRRRGSGCRPRRPRPRPRCTRGCWWPRPRPETVAFSVTTRVSGAASPTTWTGTSTVTFSPLRTSTKSMCSRTPLDRVDLDLLGQRELGLALDVELEQRVGAAVLERHHRVVARQGDVHGSLPWP